MRVSWVCALLSILCYCQVQATADNIEVVRPEFGTVMKNIGSMVVSPHIMTLNFIIPFNHFNISPTTLPEALFTVCNDSNSDNQFVSKICENQLPSLLLYQNLTTDWENKILQNRHELHGMINAPEPASNKRSKRGVILSGLGFVASTGVKALIDLKRNNDLKKGLEILRDEQLLQEKSIVSLKRQLAHYIFVEMKGQSVLTRRLDDLEQEADANKKQVSNILSKLLEATSNLDQKTITIPLLSKLVQLRSDLAALCFGTLPEIYYADRQFIARLRDAQRGILQHGLISRGTLEKTIALAIEHLKEWTPDYLFLDTSTSNIYLQSRVKISISDSGAILQVPLELIKKQTPVLQLFKIDISPVPMSEPNSTMASKIDPLQTYLAISDTHYTTLTENQLSSCYTNRNKNLTICAMTVPMISINHQDSCLLSLYRTSDPITIYKYCPVKINTLDQWGPQVVETINSLLVFGVTNSHQIYCKLDNQPQTMPSLKYALVNKKLLCQCSIISNNYYLKAYLCEKNDLSDMHIHISHPRNKLSQYIINDIQKSINQFQLSPPDQENATEAIAAAIGKLSENGKNRVHEGDMHVSDLKRQILQNLEKEILIAEHRAPKAMHTSKWFSGELYLLGVSFLFSIVGVLSCMSYCYVCIKQRQVASVVGAGLLSQTTPILAASAELNDEQKLKLDFLYLLIQAACTLTLAIISYFLLQIIKRIYKKYTSTGVPHLNQELFLGYPQVNLILEIVSGTERICLKMATINGMVNTIVFEGQLQPRILGFKGTIFGGSIAVVLGKDGPARLRCGVITTPVPDTINVSWHQVRKIKRLSQSHYRARALLIDNYNIAYVLEQSSPAELYPGSELQLV